MKTFRIIFLLFVVFLPKSGWAQYELEQNYLSGIKKYSSGSDYLGALADLDRAVEVLPGNPHAYYYRAKVNYELGRYEEARSDFHKAAENGEDSIRVMADLATFEFRIGEYENAVTAYDYLLEKNPGNLNALYYRGMSNSNIRKFKHALVDFDQLIKMRPGKAEYYVARANARTRSIKPDNEIGIQIYQDALKDMDNAIALDRNNADYYCQRGYTKHLLGQNIGAMEDFDKALALNANDDYCYNKRGLVKLHLEDFPGSVRDFNTAIRLEPENAEYYMNRGLAKFNGGQYRIATRDYESAISIINAGKVHQNTLLAQCHLLLGLAYNAEQASYQACQNFRRSRELGSSQGADYMKRYCR